ncbi:foxred2 protein [Salpingoeca rosetta]|uniref:Foxred2 protein n=1 Tax=Salpingoeca rosetta (strain ATCC 50818 / BSB-021) TaxID=946362 RepID=F2UKR1_SALR5|nr:foxred2 protein [Salpingoeca rosetta]EGD77710.1 foxred2 protein [Salpingoeca rosetta]|eukprot:XP_004990186.1 foxred2 protein [Salpingoeca rosetta]
MVIMAVLPNLVPPVVVLLAMVVVVGSVATGALADRTVCIVGAGPAGLQLGYRLQRMNISYVIYERNARAGSFFEQYPRHRQLVSLNKLATGSTDYEFNLRHDWNSLITDGDDPRGQLLFRNYSTEFYPPADRMVDYLNDFARIYNLNIQFNTTVTRVSRPRVQPTKQKNKRRKGRRTNKKTTADSKAQGLDGDDEGDTVPFTLHLQRNDDGSTFKRTCLPLVMATGTPIPSYPRVAPGIENTEGYEDFDPTSSLHKYRGKRVLILGAGNSAFEVANNISGVANFVEMCSRNPPKFSWQTHYAGDVRSINAAFLDTYQLKAQNFISTCIISAQSSFGRHADGSIEADTTYYGQGPIKDAQEAMHILFPGRSDQRTFTARAATYDYVIRALGFQTDATIFDASSAPRLDTRKKYPLLTPEWESVNTDHLFYAGTLMAGRDNKRSAVFAVHGFRYAVETLGNVLGERYFSRPWPTVAVPNTAADIASTIIERVQYSSGLYQMYTSLCEVLWFDRDCDHDNTYANGKDPRSSDDDDDKDDSSNNGGGDRRRNKACWRHQSHVPCDLLFTSEAFLHRSFLVVTLEYHPDFGKTREKFDVFGADHVDPALHPDEGHRSNFLHPVIRYYTGLRYDGSEHVHFTHVNPELRKTADDVTEWQSNRQSSQAVAIHHMMESVFIDFAHLEAHIEPLVRFLAGLLATRPELMSTPSASPIHAVKLRAASKQARTSLHPQDWVRRNLNMAPDDLVDVMLDIQDTVDARAPTPDRHKDASAWDGMAMLRGARGVQFADEQGGTNTVGSSGDGAGGGVPAGMTQEQMKVFVDTLSEALEQPVAEMPELQDVQASVAHAREASERLGKRLDRQKQEADKASKAQRAQNKYAGKGGGTEKVKGKTRVRGRGGDAEEEDDHYADGGGGGRRGAGDAVLGKRKYAGHGSERGGDHGDVGGEEELWANDNDDDDERDREFDDGDYHGDGYGEVGSVVRERGGGDWEGSEDLSAEDKEELRELFADADNVLASLDRITNLFSNLGQMAGDDVGEGDEHMRDTIFGQHANHDNDDYDGGGGGGGGGDHGDHDHNGHATFESDDDGGDEDDKEGGGAWVEGKRIRFRPKRSVRSGDHEDDREGSGSTGRRHRASPRARDAGGADEAQQRQQQQQQGQQQQGQRGEATTKSTTPRRRRRTSKRRTKKNKNKRRSAGV